RIRPVRSRVEGDIGYLRITQFNEQTFNNLSSAVESVTNEIGEDKLRGFVLDLRNNPGGLLDQAIMVSDAFLDRGEIVSTRGRNTEESQRFAAKSGDLTNGKPIVVLVNGGSASASEIVAGALQDHQRATILGTRSFGKGSVQTIIPLGGSGALRLTTARYYTPSGRSIQAKGIEPDQIILQEIPEELQGRDETQGEAGLRGHLANGEEEEQGGSSAYVPPDPADDKQLIAAFDLLRGVQKDAAKPVESETVPN
ncbi:MAG TPA: S41 family peptidase, partial [Saliniramus sp.]|nr:S41 family peptidase [Saliniramus sp.]